MWLVNLFSADTMSPLWVIAVVSMSIGKDVMIRGDVSEDVRGKAGSSDKILIVLGNTKDVRVICGGLAGTHSLTH